MINNKLIEMEEMLESAKKEQKQEEQEFELCVENVRKKNENKNKMLNDLSAALTDLKKENMVFDKNDMDVELEISGQSLDCEENKNETIESMTELNESKEIGINESTLQESKENNRSSVIFLDNRTSVIRENGAFEKDKEETIKKKEEPKECKMICGQEFQNQVEIIANKHNYILQKSNKFMARYEKENVMIDCIFIKGTIFVKNKDTLKSQPFKNCTANILNNIFKTSCKRTHKKENKPEVKSDDIDSDFIKTVDILKGIYLQSKVERVAKKRGFLIRKSESSIIILKKEDATVTWYSNGTVRIQGISKDSYIPCSGNQFINILDNPRISKTNNPKEPIKTIEIDEIKYSENMAENESKAPHQDVTPHKNSDITKDSTTILLETQKINAGVNTAKEESYSSHAKTIKKSYAARKFDESHLNGNHYPEKPVNSLVSKKEINNKGLYILRESCKPGEVPMGARPEQKLVMTKEPVSYKNTGVRRNGEIGKANFVMAAEHNPQNNTVVPVHLAGQATVREDNKVEHKGILYSQCASQFTQYMD